MNSSKKTAIDEANNDEVLYEVEHLNGLYVFFEIFTTTVILVISVAAFSSDEFIYNLFGVFIVVYALNNLINIFTFQKLVIYKDKVIIYRAIIGNTVIYIKDLEDAIGIGAGPLNGIFFVPKKGSFLKLKIFRMIVSSIDIKNEVEIKQIIKNLKRGETQ